MVCLPLGRQPLIASLPFASATKTHTPSLLKACKLLSGQLRERKRLKQTEQSTKLKSLWLLLNDSLLQPIRGLDEGLTSLAHTILEVMQLTSAELLHLIGRFEHQSLRHNDSMLCKDVDRLKNKLLDEYYIRARGQVHSK